MIKVFYFSQLYNTLYKFQSNFDQFDQSRKTRRSSSTIKITSTSTKCSSRSFLTFTPDIALILKYPYAVINAAVSVTFFNAARTKISTAPPFFVLRLELFT